MDADWNNIGSGFGFRFSFYHDVANVLNLLSRRKPGKEIFLQHGERIDNMPEIAMLLRSWDYFLLYFSFFGFWKVRPDERAMNLSESRRHFIAQAITPSAFGMQLAQMLNQYRDFYQWNKHVRQELDPLHTINKKGKRVKIKEKSDLEPFFLPFQSLLLPGELEKSLPRGDGAFVDGNYIFKMGLTSKASKRIEIGARKTLLDLHEAIQDALSLDDEHLFSFFMDGRLWSNNRFNSPDDIEGPYANDVRIGDLELFIGQSILYLYDFGEMFELRVILEEIQVEKH